MNTAMAWAVSGFSLSSADALPALGGRFESMKLEASPSSSASSAAGRLRCAPHISSRRSGGEALTGCSESTVPSDGDSQDNGPRLKPRSKRPAALAARYGDDGEPSTTAISRLPLRDAVATRLKPDAQMKPVFMPSAPS